MSEGAATRGGWIRSLTISGGILAASGAAALASSIYIGVAFPDRPTPRDLLFELLPRIRFFEYVADSVLVVGVALVLWYAVRRRPREIPAMMTVFGIMELVRAGINLLTPLASPLGNGYPYGLSPGTQNGMFSSGHTGSAMLFFLFVNATDAPRLRKVMLALLVTECVALIVSRGHYSIDVVGGLLLSQVLYTSWTSGRLFDRFKAWVTP